MFRRAYAWFSEIPAWVAILDWSQHAVIAFNFYLQQLITYFININFQTVGEYSVNRVNAN